ncbi:Cytoplasmic dynein 2 heavy chain 1 [Halotydeus destructor]|nr:Cytoplasmic dynein 2 heavy chain 1 [Halotydeus destructor]
MDKLLVRTLRETTDADAKVLSDELGLHLERLSKPPLKMADYILIEDIVRTELGSKFYLTKQIFDDMSARAIFLKKWASNLAPNMNLVNSQFEEFSAVAENKDSLLDTYKEMIKSRTESAVKDLSESMNSVQMRWKRTSESSKENPETVALFKKEVDSLIAEYEEINLACNHFALSKPDTFEQFGELVNEVSELDAKLNLVGEFETGIKQYIDTEWIVSRNKLSVIEQHLNAWQDEHSDSGPVLEARIADWREFLQTLKLCRGEAFARSHWTEFLAILGLEREVTYETLTLGHLLKKRHTLKSSKDALKQLNAKAMGETTVRETFAELDTFAATANLTLFDYVAADGQEVKLIKDWRTVLNQISESILTLGSLKGSDFYSNEFAEKGSQWESSLNQLDKVINSLNSVQRKWTYLEPIYAKNSSGPGVFTDMSFASASREFIATMKSIAGDPHVVRLLRIPNLERKLTEMDSVLMTCQKKLNSFMEESRNRFPRFYFLADEDLLLVLAGKADVSASGLLKKLFNNNIAKLHASDRFITAIESSEGEVVQLSEKVSTATEQVETWLRSLETQVKTTLRKNLFDFLASGKDALSSLDLELPSQVLSLLQWINFTKLTEEAISSNKVESVKNEFTNQLSTLTSSKMAAGADSVFKIKIKSLVLDTIHFLTVLDELIETKIKTTEDWAWQKQLRYYGSAKKGDNELTVCMGTAKQVYSFEYLGCYGSAKLVHTPLTDKCYLTCMQAMSMGLGGNPYGPAGTGKTETVKALGQQLGRQVLVFNCDEAIDVKAMTRILVGLIKCGSWGCFDEFNRLTIDVLSALSTQLAAIQVALKEKANNVELPEYGQVSIDHFSAIFITLNPMGKKYKGRNRLPDNLKALFLPVAMTVPDNVIISRVLLLAEGFDLELSAILGQKITSCFELAANVMQPQNHYDWGLRAIKSCLNSSGRALRENGERDRTAVVVDALRKQVKSKLVGDDPQRFEQLISDVFGNSFGEDGAADNQENREAVVEAMNQMKLVLDESIISKVLELDEQLKSRLGVVMLGETGVGKSTIWRILAKARKQTEHQNVIPVIINPKAVPRQKLLGYIDDETREWQDGLLPCKAREIARGEDLDTEDRPKTAANRMTFYWLIFDGDIDPEWVEALNSVLDDNKVLTLPSGERIDFDTNKMNIIFEVTSLKFASPATISRLGVLSVTGFKLDNLIESKLQEIKSELTPADVLRVLPPSGKPSLQLSLAKTFFVHLIFANNQFSIASQRFNRKATASNGRPFKTGSLVVTPTIGQLIEFLGPWASSIQEENNRETSLSALILIGPSGVGKDAILAESVLKTGSVVTIYCCSETNPLEIAGKVRSMSTITSAGSCKVMRSSNGSKLVIYLRNLELLEADKWGSKAVMAFLVSLLSHGGFYDETTFEWVQLQNFQVIATSITEAVIDPRLLTMSHIVNVSLPPVDELIAIVEYLCPDEAQWKVHFARSFVQIFQEINDVKTLVIRTALQAINSISRAEQVGNALLHAESYRTLLPYFLGSPNVLQSSLVSTYGKCDVNNVLRVREYGSRTALEHVSEYRDWLNKAVKSWISETEAFQPRIVLLKETVQVFAEISIFLSDSKAGCQALVLLGHSGTARKLGLRVLSHMFGYDSIWSPKVKMSEKQMATELRSMTEGNEDISDKKILIIVEQVHFEMFPYLRKFMYTFLREYQGQSVVRIAIVASVMDDTSDLMWNRICRTVHVEDVHESSLELLPPQFSESIGPPFAAHFAKVLRLFPQFEGDTRRYLAFVHCFVDLVTGKRDELEERRKTLLAGVTKLNEASSEVEKLKLAAATQRQVLANKRLEADQALGMITNSMEGAEDQKVELEEIKSSTEKETAKLKVRKREIDKELAEIEPTIQAAKAAVGGIKSEALSEIRSLRAPPEVIRDILEGVLRLMGVNDTSWVSMKSFLARRGVKEDIINFDARKITRDMSDKVEVLLANKPHSFEDAVAKRASAAAAPLASWVMANVTFARVLHKIKPLEDEQNRLESGLRSAQNRIKSLSNQLEGVESTVGDLRSRLNQVTIEAAQIEVGLKQTTQVLERSEALVNGLSSEFKRWKQQLADLEKLTEQLPLNCVVAAAYLTLMTGLDSALVREERIKSCCQLLELNGDFSITEFLNCSSEEEAMLLHTASSPFLTPLVLDPTKKLKNLVEKAEVTDFNSRDWIRIVELGLRFGRTIVIEDFTHMEVALLSVVKKQIYGVEGSRFWTFLGDKRVDYNPAFKLYLMSSGSAQNGYSMLNVINLCPSDASTASSLLSMIIEVRAPELERKKIHLETEKKNLETRLRELERKLLETLVNSRGNLLDDTLLIQSLKDTKESSKEVEAALSESAQISADLDRQRQQYSELANFASKLYFVINELRNLNRMYSFGLGEYEALFRKSLQRDKNLSLKSLVEIVFSYVSFGLFPEDKQIFKMFCEKKFANESTSLAIDESTSLRSFFKELDPKDCQVILVVTSPGSDPSAEVVDIVTELKLARNLKTMSLSSNVLHEAEQALESGGDVIMSNLHVVTGWLSKLAKLIADKRDQSKLIVLISESYENFPTQLLEMSTKFAYESPPGLLAHVGRLVFDPQVKAVNELNRLAHLHAVCCERRHFLPQGWTKAYEFGFVDFRSASAAISAVKATKERKYQLDFICGLLGTVIYGGKLDTAVDFSVLQATIANWFNSDSGLRAMDKLDEVGALGLAANVFRSRNALIEEKIGKGLRVLDKATTSTAMVREEIRKLKQLWDQLSVPLKEVEQNSTGEPISDMIVSELALATTLARTVDQDIRKPSSVAIQTSLAANETPDRWLIVYESGPERADLFLRAISQIVRELQSLLNRSRLSAFNLSYFLRPASALNAIRQQASRQLRVTMDSLELATSWSQEPPSSSYSVSLEGLQLEGALFENVLRECKADSSLRCELSPFTVYYATKSEIAINLDSLEVPVYSSSSRETIVTWLRIPCQSGTQSTWTQRAVALIIRV